MIVAPEEIRTDHAERADVCVIGSGAGGAVAAKELAEKGLKVVVLEEGRHFTRKDFNRRPFDMLAKLYRDAGLTVAAGFPTIPIPLGRTVGGTTTVNSGTCFRAPDDVLRHWERDLGIEGSGPEAMAPHFDRVEREYHVVPVSEELLGRNAKIVRRGAEKLGYRGMPLKRNVANCHGCGVCCFGCPSDAKQSTNVSYIPRAVALGARVLTGCRAERLLVEKGRAVGVEARVTPGGGAAATGPRVRIDADHVVLAGGAIHSPIFLQKNRICRGSGQVGRNLTIHPCSRVTALFDEVVDGWQGVPQGFCVDQFHAEGILLEGTQGPPALIEAFLPGHGVAFKERFAQARHIAAFGIMIRDTGSGSVRTLGGAHPFIRYALGPEDARRMTKGILELTRIFFAAGARKVFPGLTFTPEVASIEELEARLLRPVAATEMELMAFHPMGTCRMGADPRTSVTDSWGQTHEVRNFWIADASLFPTNLGVNPQITISALATRLAERLVAER